MAEKFDLAAVRHYNNDLTKQDFHLLKMILPESYIPV